MTQPVRRPPVAFGTHLARGIAYGIGVTTGVLLTMGTLGLLFGLLAYVIIRPNG